MYVWLLFEGHCFLCSISPSSPIKRIIWCFTHSGSFLKWLLGPACLWRMEEELWWELCFCCSAFVLTSRWLRSAIHHHLPYPLRESMSGCMWSLRCLLQPLCGVALRESPQLSPCHSLVRSSGYVICFWDCWTFPGSWRVWEYVLDTLFCYLSPLLHFLMGQGRLYIHSVTEFRGWGCLHFSFFYLLLVHLRVHRDAWKILLESTCPICIFQSNLTNEFYSCFFQMNHH